MTTEVRSIAEREVGPGGEEVYELEKGVRVRKSGGVEFASPLTAAEMEVRRSEIMQQIEHQRAIMARAREESIQSNRQANEQEILAREALEFKEFNRNRQKEAATEARALMIEVTALVEKEKALERERAAAHHAAVEKERERVEAKTAEVMAREEAIEAEKREQYHKELIRKCQAMTLRYKLEEEQAKLKLESLQYTLQYGDFRGPSAATKAKIIVEVEPRSLPEARQFDTAQVERKVAASEMIEEGFVPATETRSIEEIVSTERAGSKSRTGAAVYSTRRGSLKAEEMYGEQASESERGEEFTRETLTQPSAQSMPSFVPPSSDIKVLPDLKPRTESYVPSAEPLAYGGNVPPAPPLPAQSQVPSQQFLPPGQQFGAPQAVGPEVPSSQQLPSQMPQAQAPFHPHAQVPQQPAASQAAPAEAVAAESTEGKKKAKSGGFFKKLRSSKPAHEQH